LTDGEVTTVRYDTYCGLNCRACPVMGANERDDGNWITETAKAWDRSPEDLKCSGCKSSVRASFCTDCRMRACAMEKGLEFCMECGDYPCDAISAFRNDDAPHHSAVFLNLAAIREQGVDAWLESEKTRWSCSKCGTRFYWYSGTCESCGNDLYDAAAEEKDLKL